jgi:hypothetical protein
MLNGLNTVQKRITVNETAAKSTKYSPTKGFAHAKKGRENGIPQQSKEQYRSSSYPIRHPAPEEPYIGYRSPLTLPPREVSLLPDTIPANEKDDAIKPT